jgi:hypothetical protein
MPEYFDFNDDHVPRKFGFFVGGIALIGLIGGGIFIYANYKPLPENFDPSDPNAFGDVIENDAVVQQTQGLWTQPHAVEVPPELAPVTDPFEKIRDRKSTIDQDPFSGKMEQPTSQPG